MLKLSRRDTLRRGLVEAALTLWLCGTSLCAQAPATVTEALRDLNDRAGVAFAGQVIEVRRHSDVVEVEFRVDQPVKGEPGSRFVLREWGGLWAAAERRYWAGERALFFLHAPSANGFSSPVDGMAGILPVVAVDAGSAPIVDVQRVRAQVMRATGTPMSGSEEPIALSEVAERIQNIDPEEPGQSLRREREKKSRRAGPTRGVLLKSEWMKPLNATR